MELKDIIVGQKVKICDSPVNFYKIHAGKVGVVTQVEAPDYAGSLTVQVTFFDEMLEDGIADCDWGSHHEITLVVDEPQYGAEGSSVDFTLRRKLEQIERLANEIKIQLGY